MPRNLEEEKQIELAAIWGSECSGEKRFPKRKRSSKKSVPDSQENPDDANDMDSLSSMSDGDEFGGSQRSSGKNSKKKKRKKESSEYRLHCFIEPGTEKNDVRTVFEAYHPKVDIRSSQKGNLLNKTYFAVLTFANKAMALHAVQTLDGSNQRDLLGTPKLKLSLMLSREQSKVARKKLHRKLKCAKDDRVTAELKEDTEFIKRFLQQHLRKS